MFKYRVLSFPLLLALLAVMVFWNHGGYLYLVLAPLAVGLAVYEAGKLLNQCGLANFSRTAGVLSALTVFGADVAVNKLDDGYLLLSVITVMLMVTVPVLLVVMLMIADRKKWLLNSVGTLGVLGLIGFPLILASAVYFMAGAKAFLFFVLATKSMDTGGYVIGLLTAKLPGGNHKIAPSISPKKSWEGFVGGIILTVAVACLLNHYCEFNWPLLPIIVLAVIMAVGSFAGDLAESAIKRAADVKDSNCIVPGMGGAFDVLDSFLINGILFTLVMILE